MPNDIVQSEAATLYKMAASHNAPVVDLSAALDPAALAPWIEFQYAAHTARRDGLIAAHGRFLAATAQGIADDDVAGRATDFARQLRAASVETDATRTKIKAPVLHAQRLIDGEAKKIVDSLAAAGADVQARLTAYLQAKEARARAEAEAEAHRLAAEADAAIAAAQAIDTNEATDAAVAAIQEADLAAQHAAAAPKELSRTRSANGSLAGLKDNWIFTIDDISKVPAHYLTVNDAMVKAAIKTGVRDIPGLKIQNDTKVYIR